MPSSHFCRLSRGTAKTYRRTKMASAARAVHLSAAILPGSLSRRATPLNPSARPESKTKHCQPKTLDYGLNPTSRSGGMPRTSGNPVPNAREQDSQRLGAGFPTGWEQQSRQPRHGRTVPPAEKETWVSSYPLPPLVKEPACVIGQLSVYNGRKRRGRLRKPHTYVSPFFICTSLTYFLTSAEESSFLQINSTLSFSATI